MSGKYICPSCQLRVLRQAIRLRDSSRPPTASFVTFGKNLPTTSQRAATVEATKATLPTKNPGKEELASHTAPQPKRKPWSLEEDFIQRLFQNRVTNGPYSAYREIQDNNRQWPSDLNSNTSFTKDIRGPQLESLNAIAPSQSFQHDVPILQRDGIASDRAASNSVQPVGSLSIDALNSIKSQLRELQAQIRRLQPLSSTPETNTQPIKNHHRLSSSSKSSRKGTVFSSQALSQSSYSKTEETFEPDNSWPNGGSVGLHPVIRKYVTSDEAFLMKKFVGQEKAEREADEAQSNENERAQKANSEFATFAGKNSQSIDTNSKESSGKAIVDGEPSLQRSSQNFKVPNISKPKYRPTASKDGVLPFTWQNKLKNFENLTKAVSDPEQNWKEIWNLALSCWGQGPDQSLKILRPGQLLPPKGHIFHDRMRRDVAKTSTLFLQRMVEAWSDGYDSTIPKPSRLLRDLSTMQVIRPAESTTVMWILLSRGTDNISKRERVLSTQALSQIIHEICTLWEIIAEFYASTHFDGGNVWNTLWPREKAFFGSKETKNFHQRVAQCFAQTPLPWISQELAALALVSFAILRKSTSIYPNDSTTQTKELLAFFGRLLLGTRTADATSQKWFVNPLKKRLSDTGQVFVLEALGDSSIAARKAIAEVDPESVMAAESRKLLTGDKRTPHGEWLVKRLARALEDHNIRFAESLWEEAQVSFGLNGRGDHHENMPSNVYNHFLLTFFGLGRPNQAIEIWNQMAKHGVKATLATWDAMLRGSTMSKYPDGIDNIWQRMIEAGVKPDGQIWRTRIYGLVTTGHWKSAIDAFEEMSNAWLNHVKILHSKNTDIDWASIGDTDEAPKPDIRTLNSLIKGLARRKRPEDISRTLTWAKILGIKLDIFTLNPLFAMAGRTGNIKLLNDLLQQMQELCLEPDVATFTTILDSIYRSETSDFQADTAAVVFKEMERIGIEPNAWTFAALIKSLLISNHNLVGAIEVLKYMDNNNIKISPQVYTSFADYYFAQSHPDLAAVEQLWQRAERDSTAHLEGFFYDRMIEGYSRASEVGKATTLLMHAAKRGLSPSWIAMTELLRAHARNNDRPRMEELVANVRRDESMKDNVRSKFGRSDFWAEVRAFDLDDGFGNEFPEYGGALAYAEANAIVAAS